MSVAARFAGRDAAVVPVRGSDTLVAAPGLRRSRPSPSLGGRFPLGLLAALLGSGPFVAGTSVPLGAQGSAGTPPGWTAALAGNVPRWMREAGVPGLGLLVIERGTVTWAATFGEATAGRPLRRDALFRVESISKPVTALGVLLLVQQRRLALDTPVTRYLTSWTPPRGLERVTPRHLLSHTGGIGLGNFTNRHLPEGPVPSRRESLTSELRIIDSAGRRFAYSDAGYNLLELLVEDVSGEDFGRWMRREVLGPLGMTIASYDWEPAFRARLATAHTLRGEPVVPYVYPGRGSGGLLATLDDVARLALHGLAPRFRPAVRVLADSTLALALEPTVRPRGLFGLVADGYALGLFTETLSDGRRSVWHGGQGYGWMTHVQWVPDTGDGIVLLANSQRAWPLFGHVLRAWSGALGVAPVGMALVTWARPAAWVAVALLAAIAAFVLSRLAAPRGHPWARAGEAVAGLGLIGAVAWASAQDYLFLFSILPGMMGWLAAASLSTGAALLASAVVRPMPTRRRRWLALIVLLVTVPGRRMRAQPSLASVEVARYPTSRVARSLGGPATEARVDVVRASAFLPLVVRRGGTTLVPRVTASRVGVTPAPIDPAEPVWVEALYDLDVELLVVRPLARHWELTLVAAPGLATDGRRVSRRHGTFQGAAVLSRAAGADRSWGLGASLTNSFGDVRALPVLAYASRRGRTRIDVLAPAHGAAMLRVGRGVHAGVQARVDGNVYALGRRGTLAGGRVRYSVADIGPVVEMEAAARLRLVVAAGLSAGRRLEVEDASGARVEDASLRTGAHVHVGLSRLAGATGRED